VFQLEVLHIFKGIKELLLLNIIREGPIHGSEIHRILRDRYGLELPKAVIYMILRRLEEMGLVISEWETGESGPVRRIYKLTDDGLELLKDSVSKLEKLKQVISELIKGLSELK